MVIWALVHASGVHATVAGVALGLLVPVTVAGEDASPAERLEHQIRPVSAGLAVRAFALFAVSILSGIGFTVSLLISDLAFGAYSGQADLVKTAVLMTSLTASLLACGLLLVRNAHYRGLRTEEGAPEPAK